MPAEITEPVAQFIARQTHFYMATANAKGQPYVQHRGGPAGFLKVLGPKTLGFADFLGNMRYITVGNLGENDNVFLFLMDYPAQRRVKIRGRAGIVTDPDVIRSVADPNYDAVVERAIIIDVEYWETNCNAHISQRFTQTDVDRAVAPVLERMKRLEERLEAAGLPTD
jgi:predicted pyridoxine 5'-phosphate oxidase superfamily flavin-nucleotide-binding protein